MCKPLRITVSLSGPKGKWWMWARKFTTRDLKIFLVGCTGDIFMQPPEKTVWGYPGSFSWICAGLFKIFSSPSHSHIDGGSSYPAEQICMDVCMLNVNLQCDTQSLSTWAFHSTVLTYNTYLVYIFCMMPYHSYRILCHSERRRVRDIHHWDGGTIWGMKQWEGSNIHF